MLVIKYNYLDHVPMGIIRKSSSNMNNTAGGVAYNIIKESRCRYCCKRNDRCTVFITTLYILTEQLLKPGVD